MMLADVLATRLSGLVPVLAGRVKQVADLAELMRLKQMPASAVSAFVLPLGLRPRTEADASAGAFLQMVDETIGVLLCVRSAGSAGGEKALPPLDALIDEVIGAVCGFTPDDYEAAMRLSRGVMVSAEAGLVLYQIDFSTQRQIRILS